MASFQLRGGMSGEYARGALLAQRGTVVHIPLR
jgi:hypothetical protein